MLRALRFRARSAVGLKVEGSEAYRSARDSRVRYQKQKRNHGSYIPGSREHGKCRVLDRLLANAHRRVEYVFNTLVSKKRLSVQRHV